ncbi:MAG: hypothetical protein FWC93_08345, partial [Defluviitaleaceae bacterium]|nr:hypothetical protein [Defluviitaleaceae bacterium]
MIYRKPMKMLLAWLLTLVMMLQVGAFAVFASETSQSDPYYYNRERMTAAEEFEYILTETLQRASEGTWTPEGRNRVPLDAFGNPMPRSEMERDMWNLVVGHGQRFWGSQNEYNAARYVYARFNEIIGIEGVTHFIEGRGAAHGNALSTLWNGRLTFGGGLPDILGNAFPNVDAFQRVDGNVSLVDLGTLPNLVLPLDTTGNVVAIVRATGGNPNVGNINTALDALETENPGLAFVGVLTGRSDTFTVSALTGTPAPARPFISTASHFLNYAAQRAEHFQFMERFLRNTTNSVYATLPAATDNPD